MIYGSVGSGNIGRAWAILFAMRGGNVRLFDTSRKALSVAVDQIGASLEALAKAELLEESVETVLARITPATTLDETVGQADYVQENIAENVDEKARLFLEMDKLAPGHCILGSSTSGLAGSRFLEHIPGRARCLVVHPVNPPYLIPLVELCPTPWTATDVTARARDIMATLGQVPVVLEKEINGFILNRLQVALVAEALHLIGEDYCSAEDADKCIKFGLGLRWAFMGPFETGHLNAHGGYLEYMTKFAGFFREIAQELRPDYPWSSDLIAEIDASCQKTVPTKKIQDRQVWRDSMVMSLLKHFAHQKAVTQ